MAGGKRKRYHSPRSSSSSSSQISRPRMKKQNCEVAKFLLQRLRRVQLLEKDKDFESLYEIQRVDGKLGYGSFAFVFVCTDLTTGTSYACKEINKKKLYEMSREMRDLTYNEAACFTEVLPYHENIVKVHHIYESPSCIYIIMELLAKTTLADKFKGYSSADAAKLFQKIVRALQHLHDYGVVHNDLNIGLKNICFKSDDENCPVLIDLNMCTYLPDSATKTKPGFVVGSVFSDRQLKSSIKVDDEAPSFDDDVRALGKILSVLLTGERQPKKPPRYKSGSHPEAVKLLGLLLDDEERKKITLQQILNHPWLRAQTGPDPDTVPVIQGSQLVN